MFKERGIPQEGIDELGQAYDDVLLKHSGVEKRLSEIATIYEEEYTPEEISALVDFFKTCLLYTSPSPRDQRGSRMPSSA